MRTAALITAIVALSGTMVAGCSTTSQTADGADVQLGRYVRVADPSFASIDECEAAKEEANDGRLFNCAQLLTLNEDGTYFSVVTDIAESGKYSIEESTLLITSDSTGSTLEIPLNDDGTLGDGWRLDPGFEDDNS